MNRLDKKLQQIKKEKKIGIMTHVVVGYPSLSTTIELVELMEKSGVDIVELQIPFSDPLADGPTIMKACEKALQNGTTVKDSFEVVRKLREKVQMPLLFMCYYNTIFRYGLEKFFLSASHIGIDGLIVPDMPIDEEKYEHFYKLAKKYYVPIIHVVSPVVTNERLHKFKKIAQGFIYATSHQGITGVRKTFENEMGEYLERIKKYFSIPLAVGFGISTKQQIESLIGKADIAIIGSKLLDIMDTSQDFKKDIGDFLTSLNMLK